MITRSDLAAIRSFLGHPRRDEALIGLLTCLAAVLGFGMGILEGDLERERRLLSVLDRRLGHLAVPVDETPVGGSLDAEGVLPSLVEGVEGARAWVRSLRGMAAENGLGIRFRWGDSVRPVPGGPEVDHVGLVVELDSSPSRHGATARMCGLLRWLGPGRPPFELVRLRWTGSGHGLTGVVVEGRLWIRRTNP